MTMATALRPNQLVQLQSFWNLIQTTDEGVQKELYVLLQRKYGQAESIKETESPSFLQMQGILNGVGNEETDRQMLDEYLKEKYGL
jgi:hypothetical protein